MSTTVSTVDLAAFCARYTAAWNDHDPGAMADLLTHDIVWEDPALPEPARGIPAVQEFMRAGWVGFPDLRFDGRTPRTSPRRATRSPGAGGCAGR
jgi:SnoaL-like protein